jgi:hypothetical protein
MSAVRIFQGKAGQMGSDDFSRRTAAELDIAGDHRLHDSGAAGDNLHV